MATTVKQAFQKLKENLEITGLQAETVATRQKSVREVLDAGLTVKESFLTGSYVRRLSANSLVGISNSQERD